MLIEIMNSLGKIHIDSSLEQKRKALKEYVAIESALNKKIEILSTLSLQLWMLLHILYTHGMDFISYYMRQDFTLEDELS